MANIEQQIACFKKGTQYLNLVKSAKVDDGIKQLNPKDLEFYVNLFDELSDTKDICKFVPASGAATRMFKDLYTYLDNLEITPYVAQFVNQIQDFAFYNDLKEELEIQGYKLTELIERQEYQPIIKCLLEKEGLSYGSLPKGLLAFHATKDGFFTPIDEHVKEAKSYAGKHPKLVFTVSEEFSSPFQQTIEDAINRIGLTNAQYAITYQKQETDTVAVDTDFNPIELADGRLFFRPGGHGSLIANLDEISSDLIFIKNIDNVATDTFLETTVRYKKALAGILLEKQNKIFKFIRDIEQSENNNPTLETEIRNFIEQELGIVLETDKASLNDYRSILERPIRVCGMVKNEGEPGGGPFWVKDKKGGMSLQIVESSQIDLSVPEQASILKTSTHFNPVDLVCGVKKADGQKYELTNFVDKDTYFIANKSYQGKDILALEHPGLWNGAMANWNTIFVEVPLETFNPVKQVNDLLKKTHQ